MTQTNDVSTTIPHGHTYGSASINGSATVVQGDVHINNQPLSEGDKREEQREALYAALSYEGMYSRSQQLNLPQIPLQSFAWIWETHFSTWLASEEPLFWITGKPGSGKSTLIQHLVKSDRTHKVLNDDNRHYTILNFFSIIVQLCKCDERLERKLAYYNAKEPINTANLSILLDLFAEMSKLLESELCAFVDGLDEYYGHYTDLGDVLTQIQDRTSMKLCIASRPESAFQDLFDGRPSLKIQDYNTASVRAYIDHAVRKGRENMARVDTIFDEPMREQLRKRAQGVIIWARLAVDELLRSAYLDTPRQALEAILEHLPDELEEMYERSITRRRHSNNMEVALILFLINEFGGSLYINVLFGMWHFVSSRIPEHSIPTDTVKSSAEFVSRISTLIGPSLDILEQSNEVRLMHKTLQTHLKRSIWIRGQLPRDLTERYPNNVPLRIYADIIETATNADIIPFDVVLECLRTGDRFNPKTLNELFVLTTTDCTWKARLAFLSYGVGEFIDQAHALESSGVSSFKICSKAMSSYLLLIDGGLSKDFRAYHRAHRCGFLDLVITSKQNLYRYVEDRLTRELLLEDRDWSELLCNVAGDSEMLSLLHPYCKTIHSDFVLKCWWMSPEHYSHTRNTREYLTSSLSGMKLLPPIRSDPIICENDICGKGDDLLHWWTRNCADGKLSGTILRLIIESGESVNTQCKQAGTALHILINECLHEKLTMTNSSSRRHGGHYVIAKFATLAKLGIDPTIEHEGHTPLQLVQMAESKLGRGSIFRPYKPPYDNYDRDIRLIALALKQYDVEKEWPEWVFTAGVIPQWQ